MKQGLSARSVQVEKRLGYHRYGPGLYLQVASGGTKAWIFRYKSPVVTADSNLISFRRLYRSAINHRNSTDTGHCVIGMGGQFWIGGNSFTIIK